MVSGVKAVPLRGNVPLYAWAAVHMPARAWAHALGGSIGDPRPGGVELRPIALPSGIDSIRYDDGVFHLDPLDVRFDPELPEPQVALLLAASRSGQALSVDCRSPHACSYSGPLEVDPAMLASALALVDNELADRVMGIKSTGGFVQPPVDSPGAGWPPNAAAWRNERYRTLGFPELHREFVDVAFHFEFGVPSSTRFVVRDRTLVVAGSLLEIWTDCKRERWDGSLNTVSCDADLPELRTARELEKSVNSLPETETYRRIVTLAGFLLAVSRAEIPLAAPALDRRIRAYGAIDPHGLVPVLWPAPSAAEERVTREARMVKARWLARANVVPAQRPHHTLAMLALTVPARTSIAKWSNTCPDAATSSLPSDIYRARWHDARRTALREYAKTPWPRFLDSVGDLAAKASARETALELDALRRSRDLHELGLALSRFAKERAADTQQFALRNLARDASLELDPLEFPELDPLGRALTSHLLALRVHLASGATIQVLSSRVDAVATLVSSSLVGPPSKRLLIPAILDAAGDTYLQMAAGSLHDRFSLVETAEANAAWSLYSESQSRLDVTRDYASVVLELVIQVLAAERIGAHFFQLNQNELAESWSRARARLLSRLCGTPDHWNGPGPPPVTSMLFGSFALKKRVRALCRRPS